MNHHVPRSKYIKRVIQSATPILVVIIVAVTGSRLIFHSSAQVVGLSSAQIFTGMPLALDEEFTGTSLNTTIWTPKDNVNVSNNDAYWMASNVVVNNGLQILSKQNVAGHAYTSADLQSYPDKWLTSNNYFGAEVKAKLPLQTGFWPAPLWFRAVDANNAIANGEIDMIEAHGSDDPNFIMFGTLHGTYTPKVALARKVSYGSLGLDPYAYHIWQMVKVPGTITMYVDGIQFAKWTATTSDSNYWPAFNQYMEAPGVRWGMRITNQLGAATGCRTAPLIGRQIHQQCLSAM